MGALVAENVPLANHRLMLRAAWQRGHRNTPPHSGCGIHERAQRWMRRAKCRRHVPSEAVSQNRCQSTRCIDSMREADVPDQAQLLARAQDGHR